jgi:nitrite reductase/ring-hydroxylating ferredoxin subunit
MTAAAPNHSIPAAYQDRWIAIAPTADVPHGHIFHGRLLGEELAVWRDDTGRINVWENRCPHRGVRLTIGSHLGDQLQCRYHGWTYATGSGGCVRIPAHPHERPPARIAVRTFRATELAGFIWTRLGDPGSEPTPIALAHFPANHQPLRSVIIHASAEAVADALMRHQFTATGGTAQRIDPLAVRIEQPHETLVWLVQPADAASSIVHGVRAGDGEWLDAAQRLNGSLQLLRDTIEEEP